jgi:mono/diheme cytochrome c family protein
MSQKTDHANRGGFIAFMASMVFVFGFMFYLIAIHPGVNLDEKVVDPNAPSDQPLVEEFKIEKIAEPWIENPDVVTYGAKLFQTNCALCHGNEGKGDGAAGAGLNPKPRNLVEGKWTQGEGLIAKFNVLTKGIPGTSMAAYGHMKPADRWAMAQYIQSITENKGSDDPAKVAEFAKTAQ